MPIMNHPVRNWLHAEAGQPVANVDILWCADALDSDAFEKTPFDHHVLLVELSTAWIAM